jgi:RND family efflux transporter MFP subunit
MPCPPVYHARTVATRPQSTSILRVLAPASPVLVKCSLDYLTGRPNRRAMQTIIERICFSHAMKASAVGFFLIALSPACVQPSQTHAADAPPRPKVTVAAPVSASVTEWSDHTGRAEAVETVEIRARASGYLTKAAFKEGDLVKKGELLFVIDDRPYRAALRRARAELESLRADRELAQRNATRSEKLLAANTIAERDVDRDKSLVSTLDARAEVAAAAVAQAELDLEYAFVRSPITGRIGRLLVTPGNLVGPSTPTPLATIVSIDPLYVYIEVDEARALRLAREKAVTANIGFADETGYPHEAALDFFDNRVDPATGTLKVRAVLKNTDGVLKDGLFARVRLPEGAPSQPALLIADQAVNTDQNRRFVWVVADDGKVTYRPVKLGPLEQGMRVVRDGLSANDKVVVRGLQRIRPGAAVDFDTVPMQSIELTARGVL